MPEWIEIIARSLTILFILFIFAKLVGKRGLANLSFFDYVVGITVGGMAAISALHLNVNFFYGVLSISMWIVVLFLLNLTALKSKSIRELSEGKTNIFIKDGKVMEDNMKKAHYSTDNLLSELRKKNIFSVADVEFALLETTGDLSVLLKKEKQPVTPKDLQLPTMTEVEPQTVIMDGEIMDEALTNRGLNRKWLKIELEKMNATVENVFIGQVDSFGQLTIDLYDDNLTVPEPVQKPLLLATIKKCQADLELFALATENESAKQMYKQSAKQIDEVYGKVQPLLK